MGKIKTMATMLGTAALSSGLLVGLPQNALADLKCPSGYFCAWQGTSHGGHREAWYGSDGYWGNNDNIHNQDSSWSNAAVTGPGIADSVEVFAGYYGWGGRTICLGPGKYVHSKSSASNRGSSHYWRYDC